MYTFLSKYEGSQELRNLFSCPLACWQRYGGQNGGLSIKAEYCG